MGQIADELAAEGFPFLQLTTPCGGRWAQSSTSVFTWPSTSPRRSMRSSPVFGRRSTVNGPDAASGGNVHEGIDPIGGGAAAAPVGDCAGDAHQHPP